MGLLWQLQPRWQRQCVFPRSQMWVSLRAVGACSIGIIWAGMANPVYADDNHRWDITPYPTMVMESGPWEVAPEEGNNNGDWMTEVTPVSSLQDVLPTDWAYEAVQSLSDRYNIPLGFPDGTYRGNRALTRYEFASAMIPVLDTVTQTIVGQDAHWVSNADLQLVKRLQADFGDAIAEARQRINTIEQQIQQFEQEQFSVTTILEGELVVAVADQLGPENTSNTALQHRLWLDWVTHFSARDALHTRFIASDGDPFGKGTEIDTAEATLIHNSRGQTDGEVSLDWLGYQIALGDRSSPTLNLAISAKGGTHSHYLDTVSPWGTSFNGSGSVSVFGQGSPIYTIGGGTGIGGEWTLDQTGRVSLSAGYLAEDASDATAGLFNQDYAVLAQITVRPTPDIAVGATYVHGYHTPENDIFDAGLGNAIAGTGVTNRTHSQLDTPATTHSYGLQSTVDINDVLAIFGFGGYTNLQLVDHGEGDIWYYGAGVALRNWLIPQTFGGVMVGVEPYLTGFNSSTLNVADDTPLHLEAFYSLQFSDRVSVTPGLIWLTAPNQNQENGDRVLMTLRTTFRF